jgi:DNA-directed RNA polymerase subunit beta'
MADMTLGQHMVRELLPEDMRGEKHTLDKKGLSALLNQVANDYPEQYRKISFKLMQIGKDASYTTGGNSFGLKHMRRANAAVKNRVKLQAQIDSVLDDDEISDDKREELLIKHTGDMTVRDRAEILQESLDEKNPLAMQLKGAGRGNDMNLASLRGSDGLYQDHRGQTIPVPVLRSYSQGISPLEYWAGTYGARQGVMATKFATQDAGYLSKQLNQIAHRLMITKLDRDEEDVNPLGLPVDVDDEDSEGALLSKATGGFARNTVLTPKILRAIRRKGVKRILVRSPAVGGTPDGGLYARDVGVREFGDLPVHGENIGLAAAQALSEPLSQAQLSAKHTGGVAGEGKAVGSGFDSINQMIQVPRVFKGGAAHATLDGVVDQIEQAPAGGHYVHIGNEKHYVAAGFDLKVKKGQKVEGGDVISEGAPNPATVVQHKGIGEGRRYFIGAFMQSMRDAGMRSNRRNVEVLSRGLINHVRLNEEIGDMAPDDIVPYSVLESNYKPRKGFTNLRAENTVGKYLERPYLHYSIGTKIRPSMLPDFKEFGVKNLDVHNDEPPFSAEMVRGAANLQHDPDAFTRMFGSGLKGSLLKGVHRGATSDTAGTSFVPGRMRAVDFGRTGVIKTPKRTL